MTRSVYVEFEGDEPYNVLLSTSQGLLTAGYFGPAVVAAQTACEVITEEAISIWMELFPDRGGEGELASMLIDSFQTFTLTNDRVFLVYLVVSKDPIRERPFWGRYAELVKLRHRVVHKGYVTTKDEAERSLATARELVDHITGTYPTKERPLIT
jgi:hypothetical protein